MTTAKRIEKMFGEAAKGIEMKELEKKCETKTEYIAPPIVTCIHTEWKTEEKAPSVGDKLKTLKGFLKKNAPDGERLIFEEILNCINPKTTDAGYTRIHGHIGSIDADLVHFDISRGPLRKLNHAELLYSLRVVDEKGNTQLLTDSIWFKTESDLHKLEQLARGMVALWEVNM